MVEDRIRAALREIAAAPPVPLEKRKWPTAALAAVAVAAIVAVVALLPAWTGGGPLPVAASGKPTLPEFFPPYAFGQGVMDGPFGRAIAMYHSGTGHEDWSFSQVIVAGADRNRFRQLPVSEPWLGGGTQTRLTPDGTKVVAGGAGLLTVIDLLTGASRDYPAATALFAAPLAISADNRRVVFSSFREFPTEGTLAVLDLGTGEVSAGLGDNFQHAAFSPGGGLALQRERKVSIFSPSLALVKEFDLEPETVLAGPQAWSPDGKLLVTIHTGPTRHEGNLMHQGPRTYVFVAVSETAASETAASETAVPQRIPADRLLPAAWGDAVLGWRTPTAMLVSSGDVNGTTSNLIQEVEISTGDHRVVSRFRVGPNDDLAVGDVQLATGLLAEMGMRSGADPDRGRWPTWLIIVVVGCFVPMAMTILVGRLSSR